MVRSQVQKSKVAPGAAFLDVVIPYVRSGDGGQELRAALATLPNIADWSGKVWICGDYESWFEDLVGLEYIQVPSKENKFVNIQRALLAACDDERVSKAFYYSYDDCYVMRPFDHIPPLYREGWQDDGFYGNTVLETRDWLLRAGLWQDVKNYETHTPMPVDKALFKIALEVCLEHAKRRVPMQVRTVYGNINGIGGELFEDQKEHDGQKPSGDIISTSQYRDWLGQN